MTIIGANMRNKTGCFRGFSMEDTADVIELKIPFPG
jgi:hypothetical protein